MPWHTPTLKPFSSPLHKPIPEHIQARETHSNSDLLSFENARALSTVLVPYGPDVAESYAPSLAGPSTHY